MQEAEEFRRFADVVTVFAASLRHHSTPHKLNEQKLPLMNSLITPIQPPRAVRVINHHSLGSTEKIKKRSHLALVNYFFLTTLDEILS